MQESIVALVILVALLQVCRRYLPAALRQRIVYALARRGFDQDRLAKLFKTQANCGDGCGSCGSCGPKPPVADDAPRGAETPAGTHRRVIMLHVQR